VTNESYGALKVLCENVVTESFAKSLIVRPGIIVGPYDHTDRFSYWVNRAAKGGEMLAPGNPHDPMQFIDARDLATWTLHATEQSLTGTFNIVAPADSVTFGQVLETVKTVSRSTTTFTWVNEDFIAKHELAEKLPLYVPEAHQAWWRVSSQKAVNADLTFRPLETTIRETLEWLHTRPSNYERKAGLSEQQEQALLQTWKRENY
jgi:2'-hydroxyisoflavone reductase